MTPDDIYDRWIAPRLLEIAELCEEHGMPFYAQVWHGEEASETYHMPGGPLAIRWPVVFVRAAARCHGDIDKFVYSVAACPDREDSAVLDALANIPESK